MLHIHLIAVLGEPVRGLGDFLLRHVIAVSVLCEGLIDNAGDVVAISIRVDDSAVRSKRGGAVLRLGDKKLFLVGRLVYKADKEIFASVMAYAFSILLMVFSPPLYAPR